MGCQRCNIFSWFLLFPVWERICLTLPLSIKSVLKTPRPILNTVTCVAVSLFSYWTAVLFPAGMISNTIQTGKLYLPQSSKDSGVWWWSEYGLGGEKGKELEPGSRTKTSVHIMTLPLVLITYWYESLACLFIGNDYSAILPFFPINGSDSQFQLKMDK